MIVKKKVGFSRETGEMISEEILEEVPMTKDEYWDPLIRALGKEIVDAALVEGYAL